MRGRVVPLPQDVPVPVVEVMGLPSCRGAAPRVLQLPGHNHTSIIAHLNTAEDLLGRELLAFVERTRRAD